MGNKVSLTEADIWGDSKRFDLAKIGSCPVILRPPFSSRRICVGIDECPIYNKCQRKRDLLAASAEKVSSGKYELDMILGLL